MGADWVRPIEWLVGFPLSVWGLYSGFVWTNRWADFREKANKIRLARMEAEEKLDLKLQEWQQTKSLEDLARHRERLEASLDDMHSTGSD